MPLTDIDPSSYSVPTDRALLYSQGTGTELVYMYKLSSGSTGSITSGILPALGVRASDLPCLVYSVDLLRCLNENFASVGNLTVALSTKASTAYVKQVAATKLDKQVFLSTIAGMPTTQEMNLALESKANAEDVALSLENKADSNTVYSIDQTLGLFESFIGAHTVSDFEELNTLEPGIHRFVWVTNPEGDTSLTEEQASGPVLYMWKTVDGISSYIFQATAGGGFSSGVSADVLALLGSGFTVDNTVTSQVNALSVTLATATSNIGNLTGRVVTVENAMHSHHTENNFTSVSRPYGCSDKTEAYQLFSPMAMPADQNDIDKFIAKYYYAAMVCGGKVFYSLSDSANFNGIFLDYSVGSNLSITAASDITITNNVMAVIQNGALFVRGLKNIATPQRGGNMLGNTLATSNATWTRVGLADNWKAIDGLACQWLLINTNGQLFTAGHNVCGLQATAALDGFGNPIFDSVLPSDTTSSMSGTSYLVTSPTEVKVQEGGSLVSKSDWLDAKAGAYFSMARRGSDGLGKLYLWGCNHCGQIGDGTKYVIDMQPCYAWVNGANTIYTSAQTPSVGDNAFFDIAKETVVGAISASSAAAITVNSVSYTRTVASDVYPYKVGQIFPKELALENGTVYEDWEDYSAGWYHAIALRHDALGKSEVYVWGSNEYGQLGNGNYCNESLTTSTLPEGVNNTVELIAWPHKLTTEEFPYTDVVSVKATHYGTFLIRENGETFFAGCNKRNQLGIGNVSSDTTFVPTFTKLGTLFNSGEVFAETYGAFIVRNVPLISEEADVAVKATLTGDFAPDKLSDTIQEAHSHAVSPGLIDAAALTVKQYASELPLTVAYKHRHANQVSLNKLTVNNGMLYISGELYAPGGGSGSGNVISVDASNKQLDSLTDVVGLCNTAGGYPFEVASYYPKSASESYIRLIPLSNQFHAYDRYQDLYKRTVSAQGVETFTAISALSADVQRVGIYAVMSNATSDVPNRVINCTKDLVDCVMQVLKSTTASLSLYYLDTTAANYTSGGLIGTFTYAILNGYKDNLGAIYWQIGESGEYRTTDNLPTASGMGYHVGEDARWFDLYDSNHDLIYAATGFEANSLYFDAVTRDDTTKVTSTACITLPYTYDAEGNPVYRAVYNASGVQVIGLTAIASGLYKKEGSSYLKVQRYDVPEEVDESLFEDGVIYIHPSKQSYVGLANQCYTFSAVKYIYGTTLIDGKYPIESIILKLDGQLTNHDDSSSTASFSAGSVDDPILAAVASKHRAYASTATGEYNAAVGYDAFAAGNSNQIFGDYSLGAGLANVVIGSMSAVFGNNNSITADSSFALGGLNSINGSGNYSVGTSNFMYGYYSITVGCRNTTTGVNDVAVGFNNVVSAGRAIAVGARVKISEKATNSIVVGSNIENNAPTAFVQGINGRIPAMEGRNPGTDTTVLATIADNTAYNASYDASGVLNKNGMFWTMGDGLKSNTGDPLTVLSYTKYVWHRNPAYFNLVPSARTNVEPYIYEPRHHWHFVGDMSHDFTVATFKEGSTTEYESTTRYGGQIKSCDPGIEFTATGNVFLDAHQAQKFKLKGTATTVVPVPRYFTDGSEFYVVVYAGVTVSWSGFTSSIDESDGVNIFDALAWREILAPRAVDEATVGFQLIRFTIVDNVCVGELVIDTTDAAVSAM